MLEPPDLGALIARSLPPRASHAAAVTMLPTSQSNRKLMPKHRTAPRAKHFETQTQEALMALGSWTPPTRTQGLEVIPAGTLVELVMKIRPGNDRPRGALQALLEGRQRRVRRRIHRQGRRVRRPQALSLPTSRRHDRRPRQGRRDHARAAARDLRGGQRHRSERQLARDRHAAATARRLPASTAPPFSPRWRSSRAASVPDG